MPTRRGINHPNAKHIDEVVYQARYLYGDGNGMTYAQIAEKLGVNINSIGLWITGKSRININIEDR